MYCHVMSCSCSHYPATTWSDRHSQAKDFIPVPMTCRHVGDVDGVVYHTIYISVSQSPGRSPVPGTGINYTGPREALLEFVILVF